MHLISKLRLLAVMICILCTLQVRSQDPDPDLFRTWYLKFFQSSDLSTAYNIVQIEPPIEPFLTIEEDLSYAGQGACNSFTGAFFFPFPETMQSSDWEDTGQGCGVTIHNSFELDYFPYLQEGGWYQIEQDSQGFTLTISTPIFGTAIFNDYQLSVDENTLDKVALFPNPVLDRLEVVDQFKTLTSVRVYDATGRLLMKVPGSIEEIDVSGYASGMLFVQLVNANGVITKKIKKL